MDTPALDPKNTPDQPFSPEAAPVNEAAAEAAAAPAVEPGAAESGAPTAAQTVGETAPTAEAAPATAEATPATAAASASATASYAAPCAPANGQPAPGAPLYRIAPAAAAVKRRPAKPWKVWDTVFSLLTLVTAFIISDFAIIGGFHSGFTVAYVLMFAVSAVYFGKSGSKPAPFAVLCGAFSLAGSVIFSLHSDPTVNFLWVVGIILLYGIFICGCCLGRVRGDWRMLTDSIVAVVGNAFEHIAEPFRSIAAARKDGKSRHGLQVLIGAIVSLPILLFIAALLASSDYAFSWVVNSIFSDMLRIIGSILLTAVVVPLLFSLFFSVRKGLAAERKPSDKEYGGCLPAASTVTVLACVIGLYVVYLLSQIAYTLPSFIGTLPEGRITAADYARRGFFELCAVTVINLVLVFLTNILTVKKDSRTPAAVRILSVCICVFSEIISVAALSKMFLYIDRFGMTRSRLLVSMFIVFLMIAMFTVALRMFFVRLPYMKALVTAACVIGLVTGFANIDTVVARYNTERFLSGQTERMDVDYLGSLSEEAAVPSLIRLLNESGDYAIKVEAANELSHRRRYLSEDEEARFTDTFVGEQRSLRLLRENSDQITKYMTDTVKPSRQYSDSDYDYDDDYDYD